MLVYWIWCCRGWRAGSREPEAGSWSHGHGSRIRVVNWRTALAV